MGYKGLKVIEYLSNYNLTNAISYIKCAHDKEIHEDFYFEIENLSKKQKIPFFDIKEEYNQRTEYIIAVSWRRMIDSSNSKLIVFHDSLLPKYRGFAPLVNSLINGEKYIGVSAFWATELVDSGDIISQKKIEVKYPIKIFDAIKQVADLYGILICEILNRINNDDELPGFKQDENNSTYSLWLDSEDYEIDWLKDSLYLNRFIDAVGYPYLGALTHLNGKKLRILEAEIEKDIIIENRKPGKVFSIENGEPIVVCGKGMLKIKKTVFEETKQSALPLRSLRSRFH
jgi:methionyl-tRNA formyltransferase